jgi:hypothetical protein
MIAMTVEISHEDKEITIAIMMEIVNCRDQIQTKTVNAEGQVVEEDLAEMQSADGAEEAEENQSIWESIQQSLT